MASTELLVLPSSLTLAQHQYRMYSGGCTFGIYSATFMDDFGTLLCSNFIPGFDDENWMEPI